MHGRTSLAGKSYPLVVTVKGVKGARATAKVAFAAGGSSSTVLRGALVEVGLSTTGRGSNAGDTPNSALSPDGQYVAFWSNATNLVPGATNGAMHLYVASLATGRVVSMADVTKDGVLSDDAVSERAIRALSWDPTGRKLLFTSYATNLGPAVPDRSGPYLYETDLVSLEIRGFGLGRVGQSFYSPDGSKIAFTTRERYGNDPDYDDDVWWFPSADSSTIYPVGVNSAGEFSGRGNGPTDVYNPVWSPDSTRIAFESITPMLPDDTNRSTDIYVKDIRSNALTRASVSVSGVQGNNHSANPAWSPDGARIAFDSTADNLVAGDGNSSPDVFVKTLSTGAVQAASTTARGQFVVIGAKSPRWAPDSTRLSFTSAAVSLLYPAFVDTNTRDDVYVKNLRPASSSSRRCVRTERRG